MTGIAIVGAAFYNPATVTFPASYVGHYFFADYGSGWINRLDPANGYAAYAFARTGNLVFDLQVGPDGGLYTLANTGTGAVVFGYHGRLGFWVGEIAGAGVGARPVGGGRGKTALAARVW